MSVNYNQRIDRFQSIINALTHQSQLIGRARLLTFVIGIALVIYLWNYTLFWLGPACYHCHISVFGFKIKTHRKQSDIA